MRVAEPKLRRPRLWRAAFALALLTACGRSCRCGSAVVIDGGTDDDEAEAGAKLGADELAPERCHFDGEPLVLAPGTVEIGRADMRANELEVGLSSGGVGEVVAIGLAPTLRIAQRTSVGPLASDAPPPRVFAFASTAWALYYPAAGDAGGKRHLRLAALEGTPRVLRTVADLAPESLDESLAFDGAFREEGGKVEGLVAWDDDEGERGVVRVALYQNGTMGEAKTVSAPSVKGDAAGPRVLATGDGYQVFWTMRRDDTQPDGAAKLPSDNELEGPGELRGFEWIETIKLGLDGSARGAVQRLTADSGHVGSFDVLPALAVPPAPVTSFDLYARDAAQRGKLVHVAAKPTSAPPDVKVTPVELPPATLGAPTLLRWTTDASLLVYEDDRGHSLLAPFDPATGTVDPAKAAASDESVFDGGSLLAALSGPAGAARLFVVSTGAEARATQVRPAVCAAK